MKLSAHESRRLQDLEQRLAVEDPDLASLLSTGMDDDRPPPRHVSVRRPPRHVSVRRPPRHVSARPPLGPRGEGAETAKAMLIALLFLVLLVVGAHALSQNAASGEQGQRCHSAQVRDGGCDDLRHYTPGG
jgi:hypothetical protein